MINISEGLIQYCNTTYQEAIIRHLLDTKSVKTTSEETGMTKDSVESVLKRVRARAALQGYSPENSMTNTAPDTHYVKGVSTLYDNDGNVKQQWVKTDLKKRELRDFAEEIIYALSGDNFASSQKIKKTSINTHKDFLTVYPMGDPHIGMFSWREETGDDFDLKRAESELNTAVDRLVACAPTTEEALICNLGDFFHADDPTNMTRASGNILDVDTRWAKVMQVGIRLMVSVIEKTLQKHGRVYVINEIGNHDTDTSYVLSLVLDAYFRNEGRVVIDLSPATFHYYRFGDVFIGVTHGHNTKYVDLGPIMATDRPKEWGESTQRYWYVGHVHHDHKKEFHGCSVESFRTLAGKDAWHASKGYRSQRDMKCIVHHKKYGEVERHTVNIDMVRDLNSQS